MFLSCDCFKFTISSNYQNILIQSSTNTLSNLHFSKCGIHDPSWAEVHHFTKFLDIQLNSCENSTFFDESLVGDIMSGLKSFVVKFMIRMSQVQLFSVYVMNVIIIICLKFKIQSISDL